MRSKVRGLIARPVLAALGVYALGGLITPAAAQTPPPEPAASTTEVETIIVTARRRSESIQDTPVSVTAISPTQLEAAAAPNIQDLEGLTPNLVIDANNVSPNSASIAIRGISFEDIEKSFDPAVGVLLDGVYLGTNTGALLNFFDFESVEILRGPQGTLFGRNTTGGVINIRRTRPTGEWGLRTRALFGDYGRREYRIVANAPIVEDQLAAKLFYFNSDVDGFFYNQTKQRDQGHQKSVSLGGSLLFTPNDKFDALLTVEHGQDGGEITTSPLNTNADLICLQLPLGPGGSLIRATGIPDAECRRTKGDDLYTSFTNRSDDTSLDRNAVTLEMNAEIGGIDFTSVTGFIESSEDVNWDVDGTSIDFFTTQRRQEYYQASQEFRAAGDITDTIDYVVGLYYFFAEYSLAQDTELGPFFRIPSPFNFSRQRANHNSQSYAAFADVDWKITDALRLSVGGRFTSDRKKLNNQFLGPAGFITSASDSWQEFTPRVAVDYRFSEGLLAYASYARDTARAASMAAPARPSRRSLPTTRRPSALTRPA
jgi:iron complex outermembrane receptor protein